MGGLGGLSDRSAHKLGHALAIDECRRTLHRRMV
jgi:hypothetical protein